MSFDQICTYDGNDLTSHLLITDVSRKVMSKRRITASVVPGMDGALVSDMTLEPLEVTVQAVIIEQLMDDVSQARRTIANALRSRVAAPLILPDEPSKYLMAIYEGGAEPSALMQGPEVELVFYCADPVAYGQTHTQTITRASTFDVGGSWLARPIISVKPPYGSYWQVLKKSTGEYVLVYANFTGTQSLVIDMETQRCLLNGTDYPVDIRSDFFAIEGRETLRITSGTAQVEWRERWL